MLCYSLLSIKVLIIVYSLCQGCLASASVTFKGGYPFLEYGYTSMQKMRQTTLVILITVIVGLFLYEILPVAVGFFMGNKTHSVGCNALPTTEHVQEVLRSHKNLVNRLEQIHPGHIDVVASNIKCKARADILVIVASHKDADAVKDLINSDTFFWGTIPNPESIAVASLDY